MRRLAESNTAALRRLYAPALEGAPAARAALVPLHDTRWEQVRAPCPCQQCARRPQSSSFLFCSPYTNSLVSLPYVGRQPRRTYGAGVCAAGGAAACAGTARGLACPRRDMGQRYATRGALHSATSQLSPSVRETVRIYHRCRYLRLSCVEEKE